MKCEVGHSGKNKDLQKKKKKDKERTEEKCMFA